MTPYLLVFFKDLFFVIAALLPIINPFGQMPIFLSLTADLGDAERRVLANRIGINGFFLLLFSFLTGTFVLKFFGLSLPAIKVGGGLLVTATGWQLLHRPTSSGHDTKTTNTIEESQSSRAAYANRAFYPLTFPNTVGPGSVSVAITLGANLRTDGSSSVFNMLIASLLAIFVVSVITFICFRYASRMVELLGDTGTIVFLRLSAFILLCLGVQIMWNGVADFIRTLAIV